MKKNSAWISMLHIWAIAMIASGVARAQFPIALSPALDPPPSAPSETPRIDKLLNRIRELKAEIAADVDKRNMHKADARKIRTKLNRIEKGIRVVTQNGVDVSADAENSWKLKLDGIDGEISAATDD